MLIDSHCHLDYDGIAPSEIPVLLERARAAGVGRVVTVGISKPDFPKTVEIAESEPDVFCCLGVHPHEAEKEGQTITVEEIEQLAAHPKMIGIGETGLDYFYEHAPRAAQERVFRTHIRACIRTGLPLVIHTREAEDDTIRILCEERKGNEDKLRGVFHCFSSKNDLALFGLEIGFYLSFSGMLTFNKSEDIRATAAQAPLDRILVETDAPFLAPVPLRGKKAEPSFVVHTAKRLAEVKGVAQNVIEEATTQNFFNLFTKAK